MSLDWLDKKQDEMNLDEFAYSLDEAKAAFEVVELQRNGYLILNWDKDRLGLQFAVMDFYYSDGNGVNEVLKLIFHGQGFSGNLRECRHTYWGNSGYLFYVNGRVIASALKELSKYFDDLC